jgi:hypothetical protein
MTICKVLERRFGGICGDPELDKSPTNQSSGFDFLYSDLRYEDSSEIGLEPRLLVGRQLDRWMAAKDYRL